MAALTGMRILDLTQWEAGTSCTQALAWMGADVVKVEPPGVGDPGRDLNRGYWEESEYFMNWNANKRSIVIDLRKPEGRQLLIDMLPRFDVLVENYGPGVVEKLDLGYDVIKAIHPTIIYAQIKGFGLTGPYASYKCFDMVAQSAAGALSITGMPDGPPIRPGPTLGDSGTGVQMALAITAAYAQKLRDGIGQHIELAMQEAVTYYMRTMIALGAKGGTSVAPRIGNDFEPTVRLFPCKPFGANDYVFVMGVTDPHWKQLCRTIGHPEFIDDPRFADSMLRKEHSDALTPVIATWMAERTKHEAMHALCEAGIPASATFDTRDLFNDPHLNERGFIHRFEGEEGGNETALLGWPARRSESAVPIQLAPALGEHTRSVLGSELGLEESAIEALFAQGVVA